MSETTDIHLIESLSPIERALLPNLSGTFTKISLLSKKANQDKTTSLRAASFLKDKNLIEEKIDINKIVDFGILGIHYKKNKLPERMLMDKVIEKRTLPIQHIKSLCKFNDNEAKAALGVVKKLGLVEIKQGALHLSTQKENISNKMAAEQLLEKLPIQLKQLTTEELQTYKNLQSRKNLVELHEEKIIEFKLTKKGQRIAQSNLKITLLEQLTPKMLMNSSWKGKKFRRYNIHSSAPKMFGGKKHFVNQAKDYAKSIWLEMGFKEMSGNMVDTSFWVFDALFTAQDHPVREMQDTFYLKGITGKLPHNKKMINNIRKAHEGKIDNSLGWQYEWNQENAQKVLLRTHTTCLSARKLKDITEQKEFPAKYFALGKCFRNETVDWSHGFEFNQTEGIVVDENANFRQLLGYLKQFFKKMGYEKIRIRPAYFAYTEPSLEIDAFHPTHKKWVELGGAGMFRPEVTIPLFGKHIPVLAWGPGFDRIIMEYFQITDLRDMYKNNITKLREIKYWRKV